MGKAITFLFFTWVIVCIAGNVMLGQIDFARTSLTADVTAVATTLNVTSTEGFPDNGIIVVEDEHIAYGHKTATTFTQLAVIRPMVRGAEGTEAAAHASGKRVTTVPGALLNSSAAYDISAMTDSSGAITFIAAPTAFFSLLINFFVLPISFLGTDLQILSIFWIVIVLGMVAAITVQFAGGTRRV